MLKQVRVLTLLVIPLLYSLNSLAEEVKIPVGSQEPELKNIARPTRGTLKANVLKQFGQPSVENAARGNPPISSWEYPDFIVYFERDYVIDSVLKFKPQATISATSTSAASAAPENSANNASAVGTPSAEPANPESSSTATSTESAPAEASPDGSAN